MRKFLLLCFSMALGLGMAQAQERAVSGKVTSTEDGLALPGVNVVLKGTTNGTVTDAEGNFRMNVPADGGTLVFSFIGMQTQEVSVGDRTVIDAGMALDVTQLSEIVVSGYGTLERRRISTSHASVQGATISQLATSNFADQLAGRAAGVQVMVPTGIIGQAPVINIRGVNSLSSGTFPLIVIDGIPMTTGNQSGVTPTNPLADVNPADIESYDVLKDGAAAAIYGSRAANGVILITTKRGKGSKGKPKVDFTASTGFLEPVKTFDLANASEFETIANKKLTNAGAAASAFTDPSIAGSGETDWQDLLLRKGAFSSYNINLSAASETTNYYFSVGYQNQESNVVNNSFERYTIRTNADHRFNKFLKFGTGIQFTRGQTNGLNTGTNALSGNIAGGIRAFPNVTALDPTDPTGYNISSDGQALGPGANTRAITSSWTNQSFVLANNKFTATNDRLLANLYGQVDFVDGLSFKTYIGIDYLGNKDFLKYDPRHGDGRGSNGRVNTTFRTVTTWNWQNTLNFNRDFGSHGLDVVVGLEYQKTVTESFSGNGTSFSDRFFMDYGLITGTYANQFSSGTYVPTSFQSLFGRVNYSFKDRYLLGFSLRRDGISRLDPKNQFGTFYGGSIGYRVSQEDFFKNSGINNVISDLKIRASYAQVGNVDIGSFPYASLYGSAKYGIQNGVAFTQAGNPLLQWETSKKLNIGADFAFLSNKISFTFDYFTNDIDGNILSVPYPPSLGIPNPTNPNTISQNIGVIRNSGLEFQIGATPVNRNGLVWSISANFTTVKNEVIQTFINASGVPAEIGTGAYSINARVGQPINVLYGYTWAGVNAANGNPMYVKGNGTVVQRNVGTGIYSAYDPANPASEATTGAAYNLNPLDVAAGGDRDILGQTLPKWYGGLTNNLGYKGWNLEVFVRYSGGNKIYNQTQQDVMENQDFTNSGRVLLDAWAPENPTASLPKMWINNNAQVNQSGSAVSRYVEDGGFLRIQNIVLGYQLPKPFLDKMGTFKLSNVKVFAQVQNAFVFTKYKGLDPETSNFVANSDVASGIDNNVSPINRTYTIGINIGL